MSNNYLMLNGRRIDLTNEQLKQLRIGIEEKRKNPFEKVTAGDEYYFINIAGYTQCDNCEDNALLKACNYFNDESFAQQIALHQLVYRKLLKFGYDNECVDNQIWGANGIEHWHIGYDFEKCIFYADWVSDYKYNDVYFSTKEDAERAIKEVVEPFMKEHPEFVW